MSEKPYKNRLIKEKSPYLLQHAYNPVDWYPWGKEAFSSAQSYDKPIFLSIGYATCHWCHVMSNESFNNPEVASLLNKVFVNIKVDREELPEIDSLYMEFAQVLMSSGSGWPLNVILTPSLKPFYASTYMPPDTSQGVMGVKQLTNHIKELWDNDERNLLFDQAEKLVDLFERSSLIRGNEVPTDLIVEEALQTLFQTADPMYGGFKGEPKFPMGFQSQFFIAYAKIYDDPRPLFFVEQSLEMMHRGGINDHVGGGFSRYCVDKKWIVPHFEKMLYDNALIGRAYLDMWLFTQKEKYRGMTQSILDYVLRDMQHEEGGFYSAEDADNDGVEGAFYLWSKKEIEEILPEEDFTLFCEYFGVSSEGNFEGKNILHRTVDFEEFIDDNKLDNQKTKERFQKCLNLLFEQRKHRKRPFKDDKILVSWNSLMIDTCLRAGIALDNKSYLKSGIKGIHFIKKHLWTDGKLRRRFREGQVDYEGNLDDYASLIRALITLYEIGEGQEWLDWAIDMTDQLEEAFKADGGAFYLTNPNHDILLRRCELYDSAQPSGNALHAENLFRLYKIVNNREYWIQAEDILKVSKNYIESHPQGATYHLLTLLFYLDKEAPTFIISLNKNQDLKKEISHCIHSHYIPHRTVIWSHDSEYISLEGKTTLYICKQGKCLPPITSFENIKEAILDEKWKN